VSERPFAAIGRALRDHQRFVVLSHVRPDGDALGSQIALTLALQAMGKDVKTWNEDGMLGKYSFLPHADILVQPPAQPEDFDVAIALDTATQNRLGKAGEAVRNAKLWINIDHHPSNPKYGDLVYIDEHSPATGQILFELMKSEQLPITRAIAENLFVAISTDTGSFQYPNTTARTFEIAAELIRAGVNVGQLSQQTYENYPRRRIELLRALLDVMRFDADGKIATTWAGTPATRCHANMTNTATTANSATTIQASGLRNRLRMAPTYGAPVLGRTPVVKDAGSEAPGRRAQSSRFASES